MTTFDEMADRINNQPTFQVACELLDIDEQRIIVEGDRTLRPELDVDAYVKERFEIAEELADDPETNKQGLLGKQRNGRMVRWARGKQLTYTVLRHSFPSADAYDEVVRAMSVATAGWMNICGVDFLHVESKDEQMHVGDDEVAFIVAGATTNSTLVAEAFFPDERDHGGRHDRVVFIFRSWFSDRGGFDRTGVIRHELGHVLGFRHEHIRPEAPDVFAHEDFDGAIELTKYDATSVMHYLAAGVGDPKLDFTDLDLVGARRAYGGPSREFFFVP